MYKKCPFCKKEIEIKETDCPYCHRVLIEKVYNSKATSFKKLDNTNSNKTKAEILFQSLKLKFSKYFNFKNNYEYQFDKWKKYKKIFILIVTVVAIFILVTIFSLNKEQNRQPLNNNTVPESNNPAPADIPINNINVHKTYISLPNGTILKSIPHYLNGHGKLEIKNGTDLDAVAKLVNIDHKKSIYTVYINAHSNYKINKISDGAYELFFAHGKDWDEETKRFLVNDSCSKFEDKFNFTTEKEYLEGGIRTRYHIFEITLHPVIGGSAKTDTVSENEFNQF